MMMMVMMFGEMEQHLCTHPLVNWLRWKHRRTSLGANRTSSIILVMLKVMTIARDQNHPQS